jgi:hypothetical protein
MTGHDPFTAEGRQEVEAQLERLLASPFFSHSRRFPAFLRYVVEKTLAGDTEQLKERTLGIEIFGKSAAYDPATDPIVRVTAAEIRKRIALYYQEPGHEQELRISLPLGNYVPQFHAPEAEAAEQPTDAPVRNVTAGSPSPIWSMGWKFASGIVCVGLAGLAAFLIWHHEQRAAFAQFWDPILGSNDPALLCVADQPDYTSIALRDADNPAHQVVLQDTVNTVVIDDLSTITKIAGVLQSAGKRYSVRGENETTLMDLRNGPSVIVGAFDNAWALRLLRPLRFHFANDSEMTRFSIIDATQPGKERWTVDRKLQLATNNYRDYAIVARFVDNTTGKPTLIAAGIGRGGTIAGGEFVISPELLRAAEKQKPAHKDNMEVVLSTDIINGEPGTPTVEAVYFW